MSDSVTIPAAAATLDAAGTTGLSRRRVIAVWSLVGLASILLFLSSLTIWVKRQLLDSNAYASTSAQMLADPEVRSTVSNYLVDTLYGKVDVAGLLQRELPAQTRPFAPAAAAGLRQLSVQAVDELLASARFQAVWELANRRAHRELMAILNGRNTALLRTAHGAVVLDLHPLLERVGHIDFGSRLTAQVPPGAGQITIVRSNELKAAQDGLKVLKVLTVFLTFAAFALYAVAIFLATGRRRTVLGASAATFLFVGLLLLILRRLVGDAVVDSLVGADSAKPAASAAWSIGTSMLREVALALVVYGALGLLAAWLGGPARPAVAIRRALAPSFRDRASLVFVGAGFLYLVVVLWGPTPALERWWGILILGGLAALGVETLRRQSLTELAEAGS